jgi:hypothetical protein
MTGYPKGRPWYVVMEIVFAPFPKFARAVSSLGALKCLTHRQRSLGSADCDLRQKEGVHVKIM